MIINKINSEYLKKFLTPRYTFTEVFFASGLILLSFFVLFFRYFDFIFENIIKEPLLLVGVSAFLSILLLIVIFAFVYSFEIIFSKDMTFYKDQYFVQIFGMAFIIYLLSVSIIYLFYGVMDSGGKFTLINILNIFYITIIFARFLALFVLSDKLKINIKLDHISVGPIFIVFILLVGLIVYFINFENINYAILQSFVVSGFMFDILQLFFKNNFNKN